MLKFSLCDKSDGYILVRGTITITGARADATTRNTGERNMEVTLKNRATFLF